MRMYSSGMLQVDGGVIYLLLKDLAFQSLLFLDMHTALLLISKVNISLGFENKTNY